MGWFGKGKGTAGSVTGLTVALEGFSASVGAEYDGWGTPVVR